MSQRQRTGAVLAFLTIVEGYLVYRYVAFGAMFHFFIHGFLGAGLALAGHAAWVAWRRALEPGRHAPRLLGIVGIGVAGHLVSALPDVAFLLLDLPHARWMDVIIAHISIHFVPAPLALTFGVFALGVIAQALRVLGAQRALTACAALAVAVPTVGLWLRAPLPATLDDVRQDPRLALVCPLVGDRDAAGDVVPVVPTGMSPSRRS